jgi:hypothetical protein
MSVSKKNAVLHAIMISLEWFPQELLGFEGFDWSAEKHLKNTEFLREDIPPIAYNGKDGVCTLVMGDEFMTDINESDIIGYLADITCIIQKVDICRSCIGPDYASGWTFVKVHFVEP